MMMLTPNHEPAMNLVPLEFGFRLTFVAGVLAIVVLTSIYARAGLLRIAHPRRNGVATWISNKYIGARMANGDPYDATQLTCASYYYRLGTRLKVTHATNSSRFVIVTVTDRGPLRACSHHEHHEALYDLDLSAKAFSILAPLGDGRVGVVIKVY